jgi:hypothetical protein
MGRAEDLYRWIGWAPGVLFLALARTTPNLWLGLAVGLFGLSQLGYWLIERAEAARGSKLMTARYVEVAVSFVAFPVLGAVGLVVWACDGFPGW